MSFQDATAATQQATDMDAAPEHVRTALKDRLRSLRTALVVATLFAMTLLWLIDHSFRQLSQLNRQREDIAVVRETIDALTNTLTIAESSQRGFLLTGSKRELLLFDKSNKRMDDLVKQLDRKLKQSPLDGLVAAPFKQQLADQMAQLRGAVALYRDGRQEAAHLAVSSVAFEDAMASVHDSSIKLMSEIDALLAGQWVAFDRLVNYSRLAFLACVLAVLFGFLLYIQQRYRLRQADLQRQLLLQTERDRLEAQVRARTQELTALATHLQQAVEREREHLARELHDELGALMSAAKFDVARLRSRLPPGTDDLTERLAHLRSTLNEAIALKRRIMEDLYPSALRNLGLESALEILTREFAERSNIGVHAELQPVELDTDAQLTAYRTVQEALTNVAKHAHASQVQVSVAPEGDEIRIRVSDDGCGFDAVHKPLGAHGLAGMRHRLQSCGGKLQITSTPGAGTRITALIPRAGNAPDAT